MTWGRRMLAAAVLLIAVGTAALFQQDPGTRLRGEAGDVAAQGAPLTLVTRRGEQIFEVALVDKGDGHFKSQAPVDAVIQVRSRVPAGLAPDQGFEARAMFTLARADGSRAELTPGGVTVLADGATPDVPLGKPISLDALTRWGAAPGDHIEISVTQGGTTYVLDVLLTASQG